MMLYREIAFLYLETLSFLKESWRILYRRKINKKMNEEEEIDILNKNFYDPAQKQNNPFENIQIDPTNIITNPSPNILQAKLTR